MPGPRNSKGKGKAAKNKSNPKAAKNKSNPKAASEAETSYRNPSNVDVLREDLIVHETNLLSLSVEDESKEAALASLSESASKIDLSEFAADIDKMMRGVVTEPDFWMFNFYLQEVFSEVSPLPWFNMLKTSPLSDVPLSHIPKSVYKTATDLIKKLPSVSNFVTWALDRLLVDWAAHAKGQEQPFILYQVATLVELAMVLRADPHSLTPLLSMLRWRPKYRGEDKLPLIVWMMSQQDLPAALYSWAVNLLPLVFSSNKCSYSSQSIHLILQFVEMILSSNQEARDVLLNEPVRHWPSGMRLIPPHSFEMLLLLTFPARVEEATTERFQAIYPLLKEIALAPDSTSAGELKQIFTLSLILAGQKGNNPALASEATAIAFSLLTQNVDCFKKWDVLYKENLEASVALLKKLVDEWDPKLLSSSPTDTLTFEHAMNSFRMKNKIAITEEVANLSLYQEADILCSLISHVTYLNKSNPNAAKMDPSGLKLVEDKSYGVSAAEEIEKAIVSLSEAAKKMDPSPLAAYLDQVLDDDWYTLPRQIQKLIHYYGVQLSQVSFPWVKMFQDYPLSKLIHVPLSLIPEPVYKETVDFINILPFKTVLPSTVLWATDFILTEWPGVVARVEQDRSKVAAFVVLAMVLRTRPDALTLLLRELRENPTYQGQDKLPFIIWMMAQASQGDLCAGLYSWVRNLLPLVANNKDYSSSQSTHLILQFVEMILSSNPEARAVLLDGAVRHGEWLIPPHSFEMLLLLTFPARVEEATTERFQAIYPLLKEVALAPDTSADALKQIFTFSLKLTGQKGNPALASEATAIAISALTRNVDCFKQWDVLYKDNLEASFTLLTKLAGEWAVHHFFKLSPTDTRTVDNAMHNFGMKTEQTGIKGVANISLFEDALRSCSMIEMILDVIAKHRKICFPS